jgi:hypothetical protein
MNTSVAFTEWIKKRKRVVLDRYSAYDSLVEFGFGDSVIDNETSISMMCCFHDNKNTPAARYYPAIGPRSDYVHCFGSCKESWDGVALYAKFKSLSFMEALKELEK